MQRWKRKRAEVNTFGHKEMDNDVCLLLEESKIVFKNARGTIFRALQIEDITAIGYMTQEAQPWFSDYFYLINSDNVTYALPVERDDVCKIIKYLEKTLEGYDAKLGLANSVHHATLTVWPKELVGSSFTFSVNVLFLRGLHKDESPRRIFLFSAILILVFVLIVFVCRRVQRREGTIEGILSPEVSVLR